MTLELQSDRTDYTVDVKYEGKRVPATISDNYSCNKLKVFQDGTTVSIHARIDDVRPLSASLLTVQVQPRTFDSHNASLTEDASLREVKKDDEVVLENDVVRFSLSRKTYMPERLFDKTLQKGVKLEAALMRHQTSNSESGAYIFAPRTEAKEMKLQVIDVKFFDSKLVKKVLVFYKSPYIANCHSLMTLWLNEGERVLHYEHRGHVLDEDEVFLRIKIQPDHDVVSSQFYVHDSVNHVRKDVVKKRLLTSRDLGSKFHAMVYGAAYRYQTERDDLMLSFFTGTRSNGVGMVKDGEIWISVSRSTEFDDLKGLPDGTPDDTLFEVPFSLGLFNTDEVKD